MHIDHEWIQSVGAIATAVGVAIAAYQLKRTQAQSVTAFEDALAKEYRDLCARLPTKVFMGEVLTADECGAALDDFYRYFDLTNSQVFLRCVGRVSKQTWSFWAEGMRDNFELPAFAAAWAQFSPRIGTSFKELRHAASSRFSEDPYRW